MRKDTNGSHEIYRVFAGIFSIMRGFFGGIVLNKGNKQ